MLKFKHVGMLLGCLVAGLGSINLALGESRGRNPWTSEIGEARDVANTAKSLSDRLRDKYPSSPSTSVALRMSQTASQLKSSVEGGDSLRTIQSSIRQTRIMGSQVHRLMSEDRYVRSDSRLLGLVGELNSRLDRLDRELEKASRDGRYIPGPTPGRGPNVSLPPSRIGNGNHNHHRNDHWDSYRSPSSFGGSSYSARYPTYDNHFQTGPDWHSPFPDTRTNSSTPYYGTSYSGTALYGTALHGNSHPAIVAPPSSVVTIQPIYNTTVRSEAPLGRRVLSAILNEVVDNR